MCKLFHGGWCLAVAVATALAALGGDDAAILAALTGARNVRAGADGFQMVDGGGQWIRAVRTADGGYSVFSSNGGMRIFRTASGFGCVGPSNAALRVTVSEKGFAIAGPGGSREFSRVGSAYLDRNATNNAMIIRDGEGVSAFSGPLARMPADTAYELFLRRQQQADPGAGLPAAGTNGPGTMRR